MTFVTRSGFEFLVNSEGSDNQLDPSIANLASGGFVVAWRTNDTTQDTSGFAIKAQGFDAAGVPMGSEFLVNSEVDSFQTIPSVTGLPGGGFVVTWYTEDNTQDGSSGAVKAQVFDAMGNTVGGEFLVNTEATARQSSPAISSLVDGGFVITWYTEDALQDGSQFAIKAQVFDAAGAMVGTEFLVNTEATDIQIAPSVAYLSGGGFVITWQTLDGTQDGDADAIKAQVFDATGAMVGTEFLVNTQAADAQEGPIVTGLDNGGFVVAWSTQDNAQDGSFDAVKAQVFDATGTLVGAEFLVNTQGLEVQNSVALTALNTGGFVATWVTSDGTQDGDNTALKAQVFDATGAMVGAEFLINLEGTGSQRTPQITALEGGGFVASWETTDSSQDGSGSAIKAQIFDVVTDDVPDIALSSTEVSEVQNANQPFAMLGTDALTSDGYSFELVSDPTGAFRIDGNGLYVTDNRILDPETAPSVSVTVRVSDAEGNTRDQVVELMVTESAQAVVTPEGEFLVNSEAVEDQFNSQVTDLADGGFVVVWTTNDPTQDGSIFAIKSQVFDADGAKLGSEVLVNEEASGFQVESSVTALSTGGFVVTWGTSDDTQDGSDTAIKGQLFDTMGLRFGSEFLVNTEAMDAQSESEVTGLSDGRFIVTWRTNDSTQDGSGRAVKGQIFDVDGLKLGGEFLVNSEVTDSQADPVVATLANGGFVISWETTDPTQDGAMVAVKAQVFDDTGVKVGSELLVNTESADIQATPEVTGLRDGGFVITWETFDGTQDGDASAIKAQIFDEAGTKVGTEFLVNSEFAGSQTLSAVTSLSTGGFVVAWRTNDPTQDGDGSAIKAQIFDADGAKVDGEFLVNDQALSVQYDPSIAAAADGGFVVTWTTNDTAQDGDGTAVKAQIFTPILDNAPVATASVFTFVEDTDTFGDLAELSTDADGDPLTFAITTEAMNGTVMLEADGMFTYTPNADFTGVDMMTYEVRDSTGKTDTSTVEFRVTSVEDAPVIMGDSEGAVVEDGVLSVAGALVATDADAGDDPTFAAQEATEGTYGRFALTEDGAWSYVLDNAAAQTLRGGEVAQEVFTAVAATEDGESVSQAVTITVTGAAVAFEDRAVMAVGTAPTDLSAIRDFDGNDIGDTGDWKLIGEADVEFDGDAEFIYINQTNGRWATVGPDGFGDVDFSAHGEGGDTRVVGIYIDPEVAAGNTVPGSDFDSQQRFQNDLNIDNLTVIDAFDFNGDSFQELYFKVNDGTAYLRALMHADGNIQYANYQSAEQVETYLTDLGYGQEVLDTILI